MKLKDHKGEIVKLGKMNMKSIVKKSLAVTPRGGVVLLSPATASFDMFRDYKDRGNQFKKEVRSLKPS
jgi:UDP-N-acetylmuramoylalanine--D-glutamate ligase